ncbi:MAG: 2-dehydro-3-deoxyphosphooctonate aldolase [Crocinitomicaceae bacterium]|nr:2-dehydro-3-deoxyphosphooctonate aldolase [Crocinitomicaceae bacterium]
MKINPFILFVGLMLVASCGSTKETSGGSGSTGTRAPLANENTFDITKISTDKTYGYAERNPVMVGGATDSEGPLNERRFLNALKGPNGESIGYYREGSCCMFDTDNGFMDSGMLDIYRVYWGGDDTVSIYINMYDFGDLSAPVGFTINEVKSDK